MFYSITHKLNKNNRFLKDHTLNNKIFIKNLNINENFSPKQFMTRWQEARLKYPSKAKLLRRWKPTDDLVTPKDFITFQCMILFIHEVVIKRLYPCVVKPNSQCRMPGTMFDYKRAAPRTPGANAQSWYIYMNLVLYVSPVVHN